MEEEKLKRSNYGMLITLMKRNNIRKLRVNQMYGLKQADALSTSPTNSLGLREVAGIIQGCHSFGQRFFISKTNISISSSKNLKI